MTETRKVQLIGRKPHEADLMIVEQKQLCEDQLAPLFAAVVESTEEASLKALCMANIMTGTDGHTGEALPLNLIAGILK